MTQALLPAGTKIYYTGDMANASGFGEIVKVHEDEKWSNHYDLRMEDGREINRLSACMVGEKYNGTCSTRFVTRKAYDEYLAEIMKRYATLGKG